MNIALKDKKIRESVSAIFTHPETNSIYTIKRQNYLSAFPGYTSFPGGKVDKEDIENPLNFSQEFMSSYHFTALVREIKEELNFDIIDVLSSKKIKNIYLLGQALTPEFNPYRFKSFFYIIELSEKVDLIADKEEAQEYSWSKASDLFQNYIEQKILAVPPMVTMLKALSQNILLKGPIDIDLHYDSAKEIPMIESINGIKQFLPLSNTFPPANRTNSFLIGDSDSLKILVDPSPKDDYEYNKFLYTLKKHKIDQIFISHHHPDHHEYAINLAKDLNVGIGISKDSFARIKAKHGGDYFEDIQTTHYKEGDPITRSLGKKIHIFEVPGHDEGQLALAPKSMEWFFVGDLIQTVGTVVVGGDEGNMTKYFQSLERVIKLNPGITIPSHGIAIGGVDKLQKTLDHRKMREEQIIKLQDQKKDLEQMYQEIYPALDARLKPYALENIKKHLEKIELES